MLQAAHALCLHLPAYLQAGVQLKKVQPAEDKAAQRPAAEAAGGGMFVPNPADLLKLRAGLRKTAPTAADEEEAPVAVAEPAQAAEEAATAPPAEMAAAQPMEAEQEGPAEPAADATEPEAAAPVEPEAALEDAAMPDAGKAIEDAAAEPAAAATEDTAQAGADAAPAAADLALPGSAVRKRKSVRFHVDPEEQRRLVGTPDGAARDATITIRLRKGDIEQVGRLMKQLHHMVMVASWGAGWGGALPPLFPLPAPCACSPPLPACPVSCISHLPSVLPVCPSPHLPPPACLPSLALACPPARLPLALTCLPADHQCGRQHCGLCPVGAGHYGPRRAGQPGGA